MAALDGVVRIGVNVDDQQATEAPNNIARTFKAAFKIIGGVLAAFTAKNFINGSIEMAESARILNRTLENTFRDNYDIARQRMNGIADTFGMVNGRLDKEFATFSRSWLQAGHDIDTAMDLTERQMFAAQNAAVGLGYSFDYTSERLKAFLMGNLQAAPRVLGTVTDATEIAKFVMQEYGLEMDRLDAQTQKLMRLRFVEHMQYLGRMTGYASDGARDLANVQANLNHEQERFQAIIGALFLDRKVDALIAMVDAMVWFNDILESSGSAGEILVGVWDSMSGLMQDLTIAVGILTLGIGIYTISINKATIANKAFILAMKATRAIGMVLAGDFKAMGVAMKFLANPIGIVAVALAVLIPLFRHLYRENETFRNIIHSVWPSVKATISTVGDALIWTFDAIGEGIAWLGQQFSALGGWLAAITSNGFDAVRAFEGFGILESLGPIVQVFIDNVRGLIDAFMTLIREGDFTPLLENIHKLIPMALKILIGGKPALLITGGQLIATIAEGMGKTVPELIEHVTDIIVGMIERFAEWLPEFIGAGLDILESVIDGMLEALPGIIDAGLKVIDSLVETIVELIPVLIETGIEILMSLIDGLLETIPALIDAGLKVIDSLVETVTELLPVLLETGIEVLLALIDGIIETVPELIDTGIELLMSLVDTFIELLPELIDAGIRILNALIDGIIKIVPMLIASALDIMIQLLDAFLQALPQLLEAGSAILNALVDGIARIASALIKMAWSLMADFIAGIAGRIFGVDEQGQETIRAFINGIGRLIGQVPQIGRDIIQGLINGITGMIGAVGNAVGNVARTITNGFRGILGINSPSLVFEEFGKNIGEGLTGGIESYMSQVDRTAQKLAHRISLPTANAESLINVRSRSLNPVINDSSESANTVSDYSPNRKVTIEIPLYIDGREFARSTGRDIDIESLEREEAHLEFRGRLANVNF